MGSLGEEVLTLRTDDRQLEQGLRGARQKVERTSADVRRLGGRMTALVSTSVVGAFGASLALFDRQAKAIANVEAGLLSTGGVAGRTSEQLQQMASDLQAVTRFGDEEILQGVTAQLLTFTNITGEAFDRSQEAVLNLSTRINQDLTSASIMLGKALNDPVANLGALSRSGIQFSDSQVDVIKSLADTGRLAEAQAIILGELETQYGGTARAAAAAGLGGIAQLKNILGDLGEEFGLIISRGLKPLAAHIRTGVTWFRNLSDRTKTVIVVVAGVAAAIGPLLIGLGLIVPVLGTIATAVGALFSTGGLVAAAIAGIGAFIATNQDARRLVVDTWKSIRRDVEPMVEALWKMMKTIASRISDMWKIWGPSVMAIFSNLFDTTLRLLRSTVTIVAGIVQAFAGLITGDWQMMGEGLERIWRGLWEAIKDTMLAPVRFIQDTVGGLTESVSRAFEFMKDQVVGNSSVPDMMDGIRREFSGLDRTMVEPAEAATRRVTESFKAMSERTSDHLRQLRSEMINRENAGVLDRFISGQIMAGAGGIPEPPSLQSAMEGDRRRQQFDLRLDLAESVRLTMEAENKKLAVRTEALQEGIRRQTELEQQADQQRLTRSIDTSTRMWADILSRSRSSAITVGNIIGSTFDTLSANLLGTVTGKLIDPINELTGELMGKLQDTITSRLIDPIAGKLKGVFSKVGSGIGGAVSGAGKVVGGALGKAGGALAGFFTNPFTIGIGAALGIGALWKKSQAHHKADEWVQNFQNPFNEALGRTTEQGQQLALVTDYFRAAREFASKGGDHKLVVNQAMDTFRQHFSGLAERLGVNVPRFRHGGLSERDQLAFVEKNELMIPKEIWSRLQGVNVTIEAGALVFNGGDRREQQDMSDHFISELVRRIQRAQKGGKALAWDSV